MIDAIAAAVQQNRDQRDQRDGVDQPVTQLQKSGKQRAGGFDGGAQVGAIEDAAVPNDPGAFQAMRVNGGREPVHFTIGGERINNGRKIAGVRLAALGKPREDLDDPNDHCGERPGFPNGGIAQFQKPRRET